ERNGSDKREEIPRSKRSTSVERTNGNRFGIGMLPMQALQHYTGHGSECGWRARREKDDEELRLADIQRRAYNDLCRL
ncbi:hypothetical protein ALC56_06625, partial [Trachymyrmex septentrionalis]